MNEDFKWTDELVKEFLKFFSEEIDRYMGDYGETILAIINSFKQSKLNSSNKDWEIVSCLNEFGLIFNDKESIDYYIKQKNFYNNKIHSVRRFSNGGVK
jgi:hypothetical protein